jgi:hypothetical protein
MTTTRQAAGRNAKFDGHIMEASLASILTEQTGVAHKTDGGSSTKVDVYAADGSDRYSQKSPSGKNTQVHLTPTHIWLKWFGISGDLEQWFWEFFGQARSMRQGRKHMGDIASELNAIALAWFNENRQSVFDVIVRHGAFIQKGGEVKAGDSVTRVVWYDKKNNSVIDNVSVDTLSALVEGGEWVFAQKANGETKSNATVLWFLDSNGNKLFHLQMKGSGNASQFNSLQFHIYRPCAA